MPSHIKSSSFCFYKCDSRLASGVICGALSLASAIAADYVTQHVSQESNLHDPLYYSFVAATGITLGGALYSFGQHTYYRYCSTNTDVTQPNAQELNIGKSIV